MFSQPSAVPPTPAPAPAPAPAPVPAAAPTPAPATESESEDVSGLKSALQKERQRADAMQRQLIDLQAQQQLQQQTLAEQVQTLTATNLQLRQQADTEKATLVAQLEARDKKSAFLSAYTQAQGLPEYTDLVYAWADNQLTVVDGQVKTQDGKALSEMLTQARAERPALFAAGAVPSGTGAGGASAGAAPGRGSAPVSATDSASLSQVNPLDVVSGKVKIDL